MSQYVDGGWSLRSEEARIRRSSNKNDCDSADQDFLIYGMV